MLHSLGLLQDGSPSNFSEILRLVIVKNARLPAEIVITNALNVPFFFLAALAIIE